MLGERKIILKHLPLSSAPPKENSLQTNNTNKDTTFISPLVFNPLSALSIEDRNSHISSSFKCQTHRFLGPALGVHPQVCPWLRDGKGQVKILQAHLALIQTPRSCLSSLLSTHPEQGTRTRRWHGNIHQPAAQINALFEKLFFHQICFCTEDAEWAKGPYSENLISLELNFPPSTQRESQVPSPKLSLAKSRAYTQVTDWDGF